METTTQRPTLLTILCILSFIMGAWTLYSGVSGAFTDKPQRDLEEARTELEAALEQAGDGANAMVTNMLESGLAMAEASAEHAVPLGYTAILTALLSLAGVWMMWNLRKLGFSLYVLASVVSLVVPFMYFGLSSMTIIALGFGAFISVLFIVLYAVNLKYMH